MTGKDGMTTASTEPKRRTSPIDLETAIEQLVNLGVKDPAEIVRRLHADHGDQWLRDQAALYADDVATDIARRHIRGQTRGFEIALRPGDHNAAAKLQIAGMWIPGPDGFHEWKQAAACTADDLEARARWYDRIAVGSLRNAAWLRTNADLIRQHGETWGDVPLELIPPLPTGDDMKELVAA